MTTPAHHLSVTTLLLLAAFAAFGAVLPTAALPDIAQYFHVSISKAEMIMAIYLIGYGAGQLLYGPIANRWGRKPALMVGLVIALIGSFISLIATFFNHFELFVFSRLLLAIGAAAGLIISMIMIKDCNDDLNARRTFAKVILSFAFVPFVATTVGGCLTDYCGWQTTNYVMVIYSLVLFLFTQHFPETLAKEQQRSISVPVLLTTYSKLLQNPEFMRLVLLFALGGSANYVFNSLAPIVVIKSLHVSPEEYGWLSFIPSLGIVLGGSISTYLAHRFQASSMIACGSGLVLIGGLVLTTLFITNHLNLIVFYGIAILLFSGVTLITPNASMQALSYVEDHANGTSIMNALTLMASSLLVAISGRFIEFTTLALPVTLLGIGIAGIILIAIPVMFIAQSRPCESRS